MNKAWFFFNGPLNTQNNRHWHVDNLNLIHEITFHDVKVGIWFIHGVKMVDLMFYAETFNSSRYVRQILQQFLRQLTGREKVYGHFQ